MISNPAEFYRNRYVAARGGYVGDAPTEFEPQSLGEILQFRLANRQQQRGRPRPKGTNPVGAERTRSFLRASY